jgi:hypothetical protein
MESTCSSETSVDFQRTTWRYIPENRTIRNYFNLQLNDYVIFYEPHDDDLYDRNK